MSNSITFKEYVMGQVVNFLDSYTEEDVVLTDDTHEENESSSDDEPVFTPKLTRKERKRYSRHSVKNGSYKRGENTEVKPFPDIKTNVDIQTLVSTRYILLFPSMGISDVNHLKIKHVYIQTEHKKTIVGA